MGATVSRDDVQERSACGASECPMDKNAKAKSGCPVTAYDVYGRPIDPNNMMPAVAQQTPLDHQTAPLSTIRIKSTIPKTGTNGDTWQYPSTQMWFNAVVRKGKGDGVKESDVGDAVVLHHVINERTWQHILEWEKQRNSQFTGQPALMKFLARPHDLSPKALFKTMIYGEKLFDRHDWYVERDGTVTRYVIDFYNVDEEVDKDKVIGFKDMHTPVTVKLDVRPAVDTLDAAQWRLRNVFSQTGEVLSQVPELDEEEYKQDIAQATKVLKPSEEDKKHFLLHKCNSQFQALLACQQQNGDDFSACRPETYAFQLCRADYEAPDEAARVRKLLHSNPSVNEVEEKLEQLIEKMNAQ